MRIGVVGLGLIGGSLAKALSARTGHTVIGMDQNEEILSEAQKDGSAAAGDLQDCDVVFVCLHPRAAAAWMQEADLPPGTIVADTCGVKQFIQESAAPGLKAKGLRYVGTHPMAGRETGGYASALPTLFDGCSWILVTDDDTDPGALECVRKIVREAGAAETPQSDAKEHDRIIAYTSQMAHVVSNAYVKNKAALEERGFSAGSFQDLTRVARLDPDMWTELFVANAEDLVENLDEFIGNLKTVRDCIAAGDEKRLHELLAEGSRRRIDLTRMESGRQIR